jgi:hypothetical protein
MQFFFFFMTVHILNNCRLIIHYNTNLKIIFLLTQNTWILKTTFYNNLLFYISGILNL